MPRTKGSKNKNINTAKNKNIININVNSSKSRKGRGRPKKQSNDTTQYRQAGGMGGMAPPQVIISQPQPDNSNNSLLTSFITSKFLNESMNQNRTNMTNVEQPSYFNARDSIIPKLPETPISKPVFIKPADIKPSTIIKTREPIPESEPPKPVIKPSEVAPPTTGRSKFYKKLKDTASTVADAASSELGTAIIESAINEIDKSHVASTLIGSALRGHRGRQNHTLRKQYPELVNKRLEDVKRMEPLKSLAYKPVEKDEKPAYLQFLEKRSEKDQAKLNKALLANPIIGQDLANIETPIQKKAARHIQAAIQQKIAEKNYSKKKEEHQQQTKAATDIQTAMRQKIAKSKVADKYIEKQNNAAAKIQGLSRGIKIRNTLANDKSFQNKIDMKIKKYGDAASEYKTRGADKPDINKEFSDVMKTMRTGLQKYKTTLGSQPKKRGPKPKSKYLSVNELEV